MARRRGQRAAAQHELVHHELAIVFPERPGGRAITGVGGVGAARPLPDDAERVLEKTMAGGDLPFGLRRQVLADETRVGVRLIITQMTDRRSGVDGVEPPRVIENEAPSTSRQCPGAVELSA